MPCRPVAGSVPHARAISGGSGCLASPLTAPRLLPPGRGHHRRVRLGLLHWPQPGKRPLRGAAGGLGQDPHVLLRPRLEGQGGWGWERQREPSAGPASPGTSLP